MALRYISLNVGFILIAIIIFSTIQYANTDDSLHNMVPIEPLHYDVKIEFDKYKTVIFGECNITIQINHTDYDLITLSSSKTFAIFQIDLIDRNNNKIINIPEFSFSSHFIFLDFKSLGYALPLGTYIIKMTYVRTLLDDEDFLGSLYISEEEDKILNNENIKLMKGGELFPYWSNESLKSTFNILIGYHKENYTFILPNITHVDEKFKDLNNMSWIYFSISPMSIHNFGIMITTFNEMFINSSNVRFWCRKEIENQMKFAVNIAVGVVNFLKQKTTIKISEMNYFVFTDFPQNATEMPGIVLLREADVTYNDTLDDHNRKIKVANVIAHETISIWYYDLSVWSKEGLIIFLTALVLKQSHLYDHMMDLFVVQVLQETFRFDTGNLIMPASISYNSSNGNTNLTLNDNQYLLFQKAAIMWRKIHHLVSDDLFWASINKYLANIQSQTNFWEILQTTFDNHGNPYKINIRNISRTFEMKKECSEILVERLHIQVEIKYINPDSDANCDALVTYMSRSYPYKLFFIQKEPVILILLSNPDAGDEWIVVNLQQIEYFRVNYDIWNWYSLAEYLYIENQTGIPVLNRAQIVDDAFYFVMKNKLDFSAFWNITRFLNKDTNYVTWYSMIKIVEYIICIFPKDRSDIIMDKIKDMFGNLLDNLGYYSISNENDFTKCLREEAKKWACVLGIPKCKETATNVLINDLFSSPVHNKNMEMKEWTYCKGLMIANNTIWHSVYEEWRQTNNHILLEYLICSENNNIILNYMMKLIANQEINIKKQDNKRAYIILKITARHIKNDNMFEFIFDHMKDIKFNFNKKLYDVAFFTVIITNENSIDKFQKIKDYVKFNRYDKQIIDAVNKKIKKRKLDYEKQVSRYGRFNI